MLDDRRETEELQSRTKIEVIALLQDVHNRNRMAPQLREFIFHGADLSGIDLSACFISFCSFVGADLRGAKLPHMPFGGPAEPNFTGARRYASDAPIRGWELDGDGCLRVSMRERTLPPAFPRAEGEATDPPRGEW